MIWSEKELANMAIAGEKVVKDKVLPYLGDSENSDIFSEKNFSLLWGVLGIAGVEGISKNAAVKIWQALKENGAVDAYDKGILADFTREMAKKYKDNRLRAWTKYKNYEISQIFRNKILSNLLNYDDVLEAEILPYCVDGEKLIATLEKSPLSKRLKVYLETLRGIEKTETLSGTEIEAVYDKEKVLRRLTDVIAYCQRPLSEDEKDYLFYYLQTALKSGFGAESIGLDDRVLSKFVANGQLANIAELDSQPMILRHQEMMAVAVEYDERQGFFEQMAAQLIRFNPNEIDYIIERCEKLIDMQTAPKGVVFALELLNLGRVKSAVKILKALAEKGQATQMACFLHRLLPQAAGAESFLASVLITNFNRLRALSVLGKQDDYNEYIARVYLQAVRTFADAGCYKDSIDLLKMLADHGCFDNIPVLKTEVVNIANFVLQKDKSAKELLVPIVRRLKLYFYEEGDEVFVVEELSNPITIARQRLQDTIKETTTFDISGVLDKMTAAEEATFDAYQNIKKVFSKGLFKKDEEKQEVAEQKTEVEDKVTEEEQKPVVDDKAKEKPIVAEQEKTVQPEPMEEPKPEEAEPEIAKEGITGIEKETLQDEANADKQEDEVSEEVLPVLEEISDEPEKEQVIETPEKEENIEVTDVVQNEINSKSDETANETEFPTVAVMNDEDLVEANDEQKITEEGVSLDEFLVEPKAEDKATETGLNEGEKSFINNDVNDETNASDEEQNTHKIYGPLDGFDALYFQDQNPQEENKVVQVNSPEPKEEDEHQENSEDKNDVIFNPDIQEWNDEQPEKKEQVLAEDNDDKKTSINKILNITSKEMDKHYARIKLATSSTFRKAEQQVAQIKERVSNTNIAASPSVSRIRQLAQKIKFFKKKP